MAGHTPNGIKFALGWVQFAQIFWCACVKALFEIMIRDNSGSINFQISFFYPTLRDLWLGCFQAVVDCRCVAWEFPL